MKFKVIYDERVQKDLKKMRFSKIKLKKLKKKIEDISKNPYSKVDGGLGETLKGNLKGLMKFRFDNDYRDLEKYFWVFPYGGMIHCITQQQPIGLQ